MILFMRQAFDVISFARFFEITVVKAIELDFDQGLGRVAVPFGLRAHAVKSMA